MGDTVLDATIPDATRQLPRRIKRPFHGLQSESDHEPSVLQGDGFFLGPNHHTCDAREKKLEDEGCLALGIRLFSHFGDSQGKWLQAQPRPLALLADNCLVLPSDLLVSSCAVQEQLEYIGTLPRVSGLIALFDDLPRESVVRESRHPLFVLEKLLSG